MTDQGIVTVGSFLFRFCGLVARAFTRTLRLNPWLWEHANYSDEAARRHLTANPPLVTYWVRIFLSFAVTGTHVMVPFRPSTKHELLLFEQVARAMEVFAIAHEYGHHHHGHGRQLSHDPMREEFEADQFALRICYELERYPEVVVNPYLSSGAGGVVLLMALDILEALKNKIAGESPATSATHPPLSERLARLDSVALMDRVEFQALKAFRTASSRIMRGVEVEVREFSGRLPHEILNQLRDLARA